MTIKANNHPEALGIYAYTVFLSVENYIVPCDQDGTIIDLSGAVTTMSIYKNNVNDSANWNYSKVDSAGITSSLSLNVLTVSAMNADTGTVVITATKAASGESLTKVYNLIKSSVQIEDYCYVRTLDTKFKGNQTLIFNYQTYGPQAWYHEGTYRRVYFCFMGRLNWNAPAEYITNYISYYDIDTGEFADPVDLGVEYADICDPHIQAFPIVSDDGYIIVVHEKGEGAQGWGGNDGHNTPIIHKISDNPEDISSFTKQGEITPTGMSYPHLWKFTNGNIYAMYRGNTHKSGLIQYSNDDGSTFRNMSGTLNQATEVWRLSNGDPYAYFMHVCGDGDQGINVVAMDYDRNDSDSIDNLYFLHSDDGITWENINSWKSTGSGEFSKNVVSSGYITQTELDNNCKLVATVADPTNTKWNFRCGGITKTGIPVIQYCLENYTTTNRVDNAYISYWNGSAWTQVDITEPIWGSEVLNRGEGSLGKGHSLVPYSSIEWDLVVSYIPDGRGLPINDDSVMDSGNMTGDKESGVGDCFTSQRYIVVANNGTAGIPATLVAGDIFNCTNDGALDSNNKVKPVRMAMKVMHTSDAGTTWQETKDIRSNGPFGMGRHGNMNTNFFDYDKLFVFMGDHTTTDQVYPDASNVKMLFKNLAG